MSDIVKSDSCASEDSALAYGKYSQVSAICPICNSARHNEINLMRCKSHMTYKQISKEIGLLEAQVKKHFTYHFILSSACEKVIAIREHANSEANEIIRQILEEDLDLVSAVKGVHKSKADRLLGIKKRIADLDAEYESASDDDESSSNMKDYVQLQKLADDTENKILEGFKMLDAKFFPSQQEFSNAYMHFQLSFLKKMVDNIQSIFILFANKGPEYSQVINEMRVALAERINLMELEVTQTSNPATKKAIEAKAVPVSEGESDEANDSDKSW